MFRYKLVKNGEVKAVKRLEQDIENPWSDLFEQFKYFDGMTKDAPAVIDEQGNEIEPARVKNYEVIKEDITAELAAEEEKKQARVAAKEAVKQARKALQDVKAADNFNKLQKATEDLAKVVHNLVKALDLVDPNEQSFT